MNENYESLLSGLASVDNLTDLQEVTQDICDCRSEMSKEEYILLLTICEAREEEINE